MRVLPSCVLAFAFSLGAARGQEAADPAQLLRAKLASPFLELADWTTDYDVARQRAKEREQLVFGYFTTAGY